MLIEDLHTMDAIDRQQLILCDKRLITINILITCFNIRSVKISKDMCVLHVHKFGVPKHTISLQLWKQKCFEHMRICMLGSARFMIIVNQSVINHCQKVGQYQLVNRELPSSKITSHHLPTTSPLLKGANCCSWRFGHQRHFFVLTRCRPEWNGIPSI